MQISSLIFRELIKRGYSLDGKTRIWNIADSKLWYLTPDQSQAFLDLENSKDYQTHVIQKEVDLIKKHLSTVVNTMGRKPSNVVDLGCGDGKKAILFLEEMRKHMGVRYCPIDISGYMVKKAIQNISNLGLAEVTEFQWNISDFENLGNISNVLRIGEYKNNFYLLLGNTLGNFEINELLYEIKSGMLKGDFLLVGNGLDNRKHEEIVRSYNTQEISNWLFKIPEQLGFKPEDLEFNVRFRNFRVELYFVLRKDKKISFQGKTMHFEKGDELLVSVSYKYKLDEFKKFLKMYFSNVDVKISGDGAYAIAFCNV